MNAGKIHKDYFAFLCRESGYPRLGGRLELMDALHSTPFLVMIGMDENRAQDGVSLREDFLMISGYGLENLYLIDQDEPSMLEMMLALSFRMGFLMENDHEENFEILLENTGLINLISEYDEEVFSDIINRINYREYDSFGQGGFFPLLRPNEDQRNVEIWYQMQNYVKELEE